MRKPANQGKNFCSGRDVEKQDLTTFLFVPLVLGILLAFSPVAVRAQVPTAPAASPQAIPVVEKVKQDLVSRQKPAEATTNREGKPLKFWMEGKTIRILQHPRASSPLKVEFLDSEGKLVRDIEVGPKESVDGQGGVGVSPSKKYVWVYADYFLPGDDIEGPRREKLSLYDEKGNFLWEVSPEKGGEEIGHSMLVVRDDGSVVRCSPYMAEITKRGAKGKVVGKLTLSAWKVPFVPESEIGMIDYTLIDPSSTYLVLSRYKGYGVSSARQYELFYVDLEKMKVLWKHEEEGLGAEALALAGRGSVLLIREWNPKEKEKDEDMNLHLRAFDKTGRTLGRKKINWSTKVKDNGNGQIKLNDYRWDRVTSYSGVLTPIGWSLLDQQTGDVIQEGSGE